MDKETNYKVVKIILGDIKPVGESTEDERRMQNLVDTCALIDDLLCDIQEVATLSNRGEYSIRRSGIYARAYINKLSNL